MLQLKKSVCRVLQSHAYVKIVSTCLYVCNIRMCPLNFSLVQDFSVRGRERERERERERLT